MAHYIDADRLREKIAEQMDSLPREVGRGAGTLTSKGYGMMQAFQIMRSIIDSHQQEQPDKSLEEAADTYAEKHGFRVPYDGSNNYYDEVDVKASKEGFIAGAEWQAEQGVSADAGVCKLANRAWVTPMDDKKFEQAVYDNFVAGDKVIVQIRKK